MQGIAPLSRSMARAACRSGAPHSTATARRAPSCNGTMALGNVARSWTSGGPLGCKRPVRQ